VVILIFSKYLSIKYQTYTSINKVTEDAQRPYHAPPAPSAPAKSKAAWPIFLNLLILLLSVSQDENVDCKNEIFLIFLFFFSFRLNVPEKYMNFSQIYTTY